MSSLTMTTGKPFVRAVSPEPNIEKSPAGTTYKSTRSIHNAPPRRRLNNNEDSSNGHGVQEVRDQPWEVKVIQENYEEGPDDEMNPSHNDTDGCNVLSPLYNVKGICNVRKRTVSPERWRESKPFDVEHSDVLDDGDLPTLAVRKKNVVPLSPPLSELNYETKDAESDFKGEAASVASSVPHKDRGKVKKFWSQLELDFEDEEEQEHERQRARPTQSVSKRSKKQRPSSRNRRRKEYYVEEPSLIDESITNICNMAQEVSNGLIATLCGNNPSPVPRTGTIYAQPSEQVAIEVEYVEDGYSEGSFDELDDLDDPMTVAGSFMQLGEDGSAKRVAPRARSPTRVLITNMPSELTRGTSSQQDGINDTKSKLEPDEEARAPEYEQAEVVSVSSSSISKTSRNSMLGSISKLSKKKFNSKKKKNAEKNQSETDTEHMEGWSAAKKVGYSDLLKKGYSASEAEEILDEIEYETGNEFSDVESDVEGSTTSKSKSRQLLWRRKKTTSNETSSESSSSSKLNQKGKQMLKSFLKAKKNKMKKKKDDGDISDSKGEQDVTKKKPRALPVDEDLNHEPTEIPLSPSIEEESISPKVPLVIETTTKTNLENDVGVVPSRRDKILKNIQSNAKNRPKSVDPSTRFMHQNPSDKSLDLTEKSQSEVRSVSAPKGGRISPLSAKARPIPGIDDLLKSSLSWDNFKPIDKDIHPSKSTDKWGSILEKHDSHDSQEMRPSLSYDSGEKPQRMNTATEKSSLIQSKQQLQRKQGNSNTANFENNTKKLEKGFDLRLSRSLSNGSISQNLKMGMKRSKSWSKLDTRNSSFDSEDSIFDDLDKNKRDERGNGQENPGKRVQSIDDLFELETPIRSASALRTKSKPTYSQIRNTEEDSSEDESGDVNIRGRRRSENLGTKDSKIRSTSTSRGAELRRIRLSIRDNQKTRSTLASQMEENDEDVSPVVEDYKESLISQERASMASQLVINEKQEDLHHLEEDREEVPEEPPYVSVDIDEQSLLSYGSNSYTEVDRNAMNEKSLGSSGTIVSEEMPIESNPISMGSTSLKNEDEKSIISQDDMSSKGSVISRRMERAKMVNPWLRDANLNASAENIPNLIPANANKSNKPKEENTESVPIQSVMDREMNVTKEDVTLGFYLENERKNQRRALDNETVSIASTLGARSVITTATDATWKRRNGTSKERLIKAKKTKMAQGSSGWFESMKNATSDGKVPYHKWDAKLGWVVIPGFEEKVKEMKSLFDVENRTLQDTMETSLELVDEISESSSDSNENLESSTEILLQRNDQKSDWKGKFAPARSIKSKLSYEKLVQDKEETTDIYSSISKVEEINENSLNVSAERNQAQNGTNKPNFETTNSAKTSFTSSSPSGKSSSTNDTTSPITKKKLFESEPIKLNRNPKDVKISDRRRNSLKSAEASYDSENKETKKNIKRDSRDLIEKFSSEKTLASPRSVLSDDDQEQEHPNDSNGSARILFDKYFSQSGDDFEKSNEESRKSIQVNNHNEKLPDPVVNVVKEKISPEESQLFVPNNTDFQDPITSTTSTNSGSGKSQDRKTFALTQTTQIDNPIEPNALDIHERGLSRLASMKAKRQFEEKKASNEKEKMSLMERLAAAKKLSSASDDDLDPSSLLKKKMERLQSTLSMDSGIESKDTGDRGKQLMISDTNENSNIEKECDVNESSTKKKYNKSLPPNARDGDKLDQAVFRKKDNRQTSPLKSKNYKKQNSTDSTSAMESSAKFTNAVSSMIDKFGGKNEKNSRTKNSGRDRELKQQKSTSGPGINVEEESIFLDSLARTLSDTEDYRSDTIAKVNRRKGKKSSGPEKIALGNSFIFEEAFYPTGTDAKSDHSSSLLTNAQNKRFQSEERSTFSVPDSAKESKNWSEVNSDTGAEGCTGGFFSRMAACNAGLGKPVGTGEMPMAHLAFLMSSPSSGKSEEKESIGAEVAKDIAQKASFPPTPEVAFKSVAAMSSMDSSITFRNNEVRKSRPKSETARSFASQSQYLEDIAMKAARSGFKKTIGKQDKEGDVTSQISQKSLKSEAWQTFLAKKKNGNRFKLPNTGPSVHDLEVSKAAERFASRKVEEMMATMSTSDSDLVKKKHANDIIDSISNTGSTFSASDARRFLAQRDRNTSSNGRPSNDIPLRTKTQATNRSRSRLKNRPEYAEAAEQLAAARVEAMMSALSSQSINEKSRT